MKPLLVALMLVFAPLTVQAAEQVAPGAGSILQQIQRANPPAPSSTGTGLIIEEAARATLPASAPFLVNSIQLSGNTRFETTTLHALVADAEGKDLTLSEVGELAHRITAYYHIRGYPLARAVIPAQTIQMGVLHIEIIEARYGKITLDNRSRVKDSLLQATLYPLQGGQEVGQRQLDHTLLLLSDVPGVAIAATLKPGESVGTSDMLVETTAKAPVAGSVTLDNYGNRYTGRVRLGGTVNLVDPLHDGDDLSLDGLTSGSGMNYGGLTYQSLLNGQGTRIGGSYSALHYGLGNSLESLDGYGTAQVESLWIQQPLVRTRNANLYGQIQYDHKQLDDYIGAASIRTDRHLDNWTVSVAGDLRDALLSGGVNTWSVGWTLGRVEFDDADAQQTDSATVKSQGGFSKWTANFSHLQGLSPANALNLTISGQWANNNLDPAEKMIAGGPYTVRAYDLGVVSGDTGILGSAEFRHGLGQVWNGQLQVVTFIDSERVTVNRSTRAAGPNGATLSGAGVGLNWGTVSGWHGKVYVATPLGSTPELVGTGKSTQAWVEIGNRFE